MITLSTVKAFLIDQLNRYKSSKKRYRIGLPLVSFLFVWYLFCLPSTLFDVPYSTVVLDRDGALLGARISADQQWRFPTVDSVPKKYEVCLKEFEDRYFNYHWGVNPVSMGRAVWQNVTQRRIVSGASTITMQTIRLSRNESRTLPEKLIEAILATRLEFSYSKKEIVNLYASHAPMGANVIGISAASWRYFGHDPSTLSWAEAATLAVLPNSPAMMHFGRNRDKLLNKRNRLLASLHQKGEIEEMDYQLAISEPLPSQPHILPQIAPHLVAKIYVEEGGKQVRSTIDKQRQQHIENILMRWNAEFAQNEIKNITAIVIDVEKREVVAYCGNVHFEKKSSANQVDILQSNRSTGSILKPFLYCSMLQDGDLLPNQLLADVPININGFSPKNFSLKYDGAAPASEALARSLNVPFVVSLRKQGIPKFHSLLRKIGLTTINRSPADYGLSLILGGAEAKLWDITCVYADMASTLNHYTEAISKSGYELSPITYKVDDEQGSGKSPVFMPGAIWQTFEALTNANRPEEMDWRSVSSMQKIAWKTGTSFGFRDAWSVGITSKYVVGVWVGNSDGEGRPGLTGARTAGAVMFDIFDYLPSSRWFEMPKSDLVKVETCKESGFLKGYNCPDSSADTTYICKKGRNAQACPYHVAVNVSEDMKYQVFENCAGGRGIVHTSWFVLPASWEMYYRDQHPSYVSLPPYSPECLGNTTSKVMEFIYPSEQHSVVNLPKQLDGSLGDIVFELAHRSPRTRVFWHLDGSYIGETSDFHKKSATPSLGEHHLTVVDEDGNRMATKFTVK